MPENKINEAAWDLTTSMRETNRAIADSVVAAQERNIRFSQSIFENGIEVLKSHTDSVRTLTESMIEQYYKQQDAFQRLVRLSANAYINLLFVPLSSYQHALETAGSITSQAFETAQRISRQEAEAADRASR